MRKNYFRSFMFSAIVTLGITSANAQQKEDFIKQKNAGSSGNPSLIVFKKSSFYQQSQAKQVLREHLNLSHNDNFKTLKIENDKLGFTHQKNQQYYKNVKVEFGTYTIHSKNGKIESISGEFYETKNVTIIPKFSKGQAFQYALNHIGAKSYLWEDTAASKELGYKKPEGELVLLPIFDNLKKKGNIDKLRLAYKYEIFTIQPLGGADVYVDAQTGKMLFYNARVKHADNFGHDGRTKKTTILKPIKSITTMISGSAQTRYSGTQSIETTSSGGNYTLNDASRKVYTRNANHLAPSGSSLPYITNYTEFTDNDNSWTAAEYDNANKDNAALDAHWGAMKTYDYWKNIHNRNSYDNAGSQLRSYVHVDNNYDNAFWYLSVMSYGDGSSNGNEGNGNFDALTSIDVAAHEIGHAITEFTANLAYQRESGAMNEGFSDIWGASVEHYAKGNGNDAAPDASIWLIGDEIDRRNGSAALRSMNNPKSLGQPDTYQGTNWVNVNCGTPVKSNDYCGVHTNSGVLNYWFYLLVAGGSGTNDVGGNYNVSGIGMTKAGNIAYRLENNYLTANATYSDARTGAIQAAIDLYGAGSAEEIAVTNSWHAVGVGTAFGGGSSYCTSKGNSVSDEYISRTQLNTIDHSSNAQLYSDFTSISTDLAKGSQYTITITPTWTGTIYSEGYAVWIDYNGDHDFEDTGELVFSKSASKTTPVSGTFTVPLSATDGATRMRVSLKYNGIPTPCETFDYGEVEDYTINIGSSGGGDTQAPTAPSGLSASNTTQTSVDLSWTASTDNVGVTGYDIYQGSTNVAFVTGTSTAISGLTANTTYTFTVKAKDAADNISTASNAISITTLSSGGGGSTQILFDGSFETGWEGWTDGGGDCYRINSSRSYDGNYSIRIRDNSGTASAMTLSTFDITSYDNIEIKFYFYPYSMENGEDFWVRYYDGSSWNTVASYASGSSFNNGSFYTATLNIPATNYNFASNAQFRFQCDASSNYDYVYIDKVTITATSGGGVFAPNSIANIGATSINGFAGVDVSDSSNLELDGLILSPNPASNLVSLKVDLDIEDANGVNVEMKIFNIQGRLIQSKKWNGINNSYFEKTVNISNLARGMYFVKINSSNGFTETQKLIIR